MTKCNTLSLKIVAKSKTSDSCSFFHTQRNAMVSLSLSLLSFYLFIHERNSIFFCYRGDLHVKLFTNLYYKLIIVNDFLF